MHETLMYIEDERWSLITWLYRYGGRTKQENRNEDL